MWGERGGGERERGEDSKRGGESERGGERERGWRERGGMGRERERGGERERGVVREREGGGERERGEWGERKRGGEREREGVWGWGGGGGGGQTACQLYRDRNREDNLLLIFIWQCKTSHMFRFVIIKSAFLLTVCVFGSSLAVGLTNALAVSGDSG